MRGALALAGAVTTLVFTSPALAVDFTSSTLTAPANGTFPLYTVDAPNTIHIQGTTAGGDSDADIVCFFGSSRRVLKAGVSVTAGAFSEDVDLLPLADYPSPRSYCVLRAIPAGDVTNYPPGQATAFAGSEVGVGYFDTFDIAAAGINHGRMFDYTLDQAQKKGATDLNSISSCGLDNAYIFDPLTFEQSKPLFYCDAWMSPQNGCANASGTCHGATRSDLQVDGANAYFSAAAAGLYDVDATHKSTLLTGFPNVVIDKTIDPLNGDVHFTESAEIVKCSPKGSAYHAHGNDAAWPADCSSFAPVGVKLDRTISTDRDGRRTTIIDIWSSTDGASHSLDMLYDDDFSGDAGNQPSPSFQHSWVGPAYAPATLEQTIPGPSANTPVTTMIDGNAGMPDVLRFPQGAATHSEAPSDVFYSYQDGSSSSLLWHYARTVPAGGTLYMGQSYIAGATKTEVSDQVPEEQARLGRPRIDITGPGSTTDTASVLATGTATDPAGGITGLTVNGDAVSVGGDGSWSKALTLAEGDNTITATATDTSGNTTTATKKVTFTPPQPPAPVPVPGPAPAASDRTAPALGLAISRTRLAALLRKGLPVKVRCSEPCTFSLTLKQGRTTIGKLSGRLTTAGTKKVTVKLTKKAKKRLRKAKRVRLTLSLTAKDTAGNTARKTARTTVRR